MEARPGRFEELWKDAVDLSHEYVDTIHDKTWLNDEITPYHLYLKFLYEHFGRALTSTRILILISRKASWTWTTRSRRSLPRRRSSTLTTASFSPTWSASARLTYPPCSPSSSGAKFLVICPPVLKDYWEETFFEFGIRGYKVESLGKLDHVIEGA